MINHTVKLNIYQCKDASQDEEEEEEGRKESL